jgi:uncharacterized membrane protein YkoI
MKSYEKLSLAVCFLFLCGTSGQAKEERVKMSDLPPAVQATVKEQGKGATIRGLAKEVEGGKTRYEVEMTVNGHGKDIEMDENGQVVEVEEVVSLNSLPAAAKAAIEKGAGSGRVLKVESVMHGSTLVFYEASVQKSGKKSEVRVDPQGNPAPEQ